MNLDICIKILRELRKAGVSAELYPDPVKMKKQMSYANSRNIPFVALIGESELSEGTVTLKNMKTGSQEKIKYQDIIRHITG
jgi:histidyl-tRNA synthetase